MIRRAYVAAVLLIVAACGSGSSPMAPSAGPQPTMALDSGSYLLMLTMATSGTSGFSACVSLTIGSAPGFAAVIVPTPVQVERSGDTVTVRADDPTSTFRMQLQLLGARLSGTASGQYRSGPTTVTVNGPLSAPAGPAAATGIVGPSSISGALDGSIGIGEMTCTNNGHGWSLTPR